MVVVYDNRNTQQYKIPSSRWRHADSPFLSSALRDFVVKEGVTRRHMFRITPQAERPYFDLSSVHEKPNDQEKAKLGNAVENTK